MNSRVLHAALFSIGLIVYATAPFGAHVASAADVVIVEEHWELSVGGPDPSRSAPQVQMLISPTATIDDDFFLVTLNHSSFPEFASGGVQVQHWNGDDCLEVATGTNGASLATDNEVVSWVQRISLADGELSFEVADGASSTWGAFGGDGDLRVAFPSNLARLNDYKPANSIEQSGIGFAGNRVSSLTLKRIRVFTDDGKMHEHVAPIDIDTDIDP